MSTYYDLYETPDPSGEGKKKPLHARVRSKGTITAKEFQERMVKEQHMPHAMIVGIMQAISNALGDWLADGYNVELDELGYFSTTLKCTRTAMNKKDIRAESVRFETVKFRPSKAFKKYVRYQMELERIDKKASAKKPAVAPEKRKEMMLKFLEANVCITRAEYSRLTNVTDRRASCDLQEYLAEGIIRKRGGGRSVVYIKRNQE
ncbi:MAG: HU family DNA-binding protein [Bacteroides cellulosilyticus]